MQIFAKLAPSAIFGQKWGVQKELLCAFIACFHLRWLWSHALSRMIIMCVDSSALHTVICIRVRMIRKLWKNVYYIS